MYREDADSKDFIAFLDRKLWEDVAESLTKACCFYDAAFVYSHLSRGADQILQLDDPDTEIEEWKVRRTISTLALLNREYATALLEYHASFTTRPDFVSWKRTLLDGGIDEALSSCDVRLSEFPNDLAVGIL